MERSELLGMRIQQNNNNICMYDRDACVCDASRLTRHATAVAALTYSHRRAGTVRIECFPHFRPS